MEEKPLSADERRALVSCCEETLKDSLAVAREAPRCEETSFAQTKPEEYREEFLQPIQKVIDDWSTSFTADEFTEHLKTAQSVQPLTDEERIR
jgi:hypothetical protein